MADTPIDALNDWQGNEVISSVKLNTMNGAIRYASKLSKDADDSANEAKATANQAQQNASQASTKADTAINTANSANTAAGNANTTASQALSQAKDAVSKIEQAIKGTGYATQDDLTKKFGDVNDQINVIKGDLSNRWVSINDFAQISADKLTGPIIYYISNNTNNATPGGHWGQGVIYPYILRNWSYVRITFFDGNNNKVYTNITSNNTTQYNPTAWKEVTGMDPQVLADLKDMAQILKQANGVDLNTLTDAKFYDVENIGSNGPDSVRYATVVAIPSKNDTSGTSCTQLLMDQMTGSTYVRSEWAGRWTTWSQLIDTNYLKTHSLDNSLKVHDLGTIKDLNNANIAGEYVGNSDGVANMPIDPDTNKAITGTTITVNVITDDLHKNGSQEVIQNAKGYKYLRGLNNGTWSAWSVLTPFS